MGAKAISPTPHALPCEVRVRPLRKSRDPLGPGLGLGTWVQVSPFQHRVRIEGYKRSLCCVPGSSRTKASASHSRGPTTRILARLGIDAIEVKAATQIGEDHLETF